MRLQPMRFSGILTLFIFLTVSVVHPVELTIPALEKAAVNTKDPAVFYDLGVLYAGAGDTGRAILDFRKALLLKPSDRAAADNLNRLRQSIGIPPYFSEASPIEKAVLFPFTIFSLNGGLVFGIVLFVLGSAVLSLVLSNIITLPFEGRVRIISIIAMIAGLVYITASFVRYRFTFDPKNAVILTDGALLERPDAKSLPLAEAPGGMECVVRDDNDGYVRVNTLDGHEGWVVSANVERLWEGKK